MAEQKAQNPMNYYFADDEGIEAFQVAFARLLAAARKTVISNYIPPENMQRFRHGGDLSHPGSPDAASGKVQEFTIKAVTNFDDIIENRLSAIGQNVWELTDAMHGQFAGMLYSTVSATCEQTGNIIDAKGQSSLADSFLAMIERIEFVADKNGNVKMPEIHANPDLAKRLLEEAQSMSPEHKERLEKLQGEKIAEAKAREIERKAKFTKYGNTP